MSGGVACNKLLAKVAAGINKPDQQTIVPPRAAAGLLADMPLGKVRNFGGEARLRAAEHGLHHSRPGAPDRGRTSPPPPPSPLPRAHPLGQGARSAQAERHLRCGCPAVAGWEGAPAPPCASAVITSLASRARSKVIGSVPLRSSPPSREPSNPPPPPPPGGTAPLVISFGVSHDRRFQFPAARSASRWCS